MEKQKINTQDEKTQKQPKDADFKLTNCLER